MSSWMRALVTLGYIAILAGLVLFFCWSYYINSIRTDDYFLTANLTVHQRLIPPTRFEMYATFLRSLRYFALRAHPTAHNKKISSSIRNIFQKEVARES